MKKSRSKTAKSSGGAAKKRVVISDKTTEIKLKEKSDEFLDPDDEEVGFGAWLKSGEGIEWMRLFVIGNSIAVFLTMAWPHLKKTLNTLMEIIYGEE